MIISFTPREVKSLSAFLQGKYRGFSNNLSEYVYFSNDKKEAAKEAAAYRRAKKKILSALGEIPEEVIRKT